MSSQLSIVTGKRQQWITGKCKTIRGKKASNKGDSTVMSGSLKEVICRWIEKWRRNGFRQVKANFWCWKESFILLVWGPSLKQVFIYGVNFISSTNCTPVRDKKIIKITTMLNQLASIGILLNWGTIKLSLTSSKYMQEVDIWQSLAENAQSCIMTISKDKGNGKWKCMGAQDFCQVL